MLSKINIVNAIFERKTSDIFGSVASSHLNTDMMITQLKLSRKQYYSRISSLTKAGLIKRQNGRYLLTEFGKVIYSAYANFEAKIESALNNYWKLKAVDSLMLSQGISSRQERSEIVSELIDNEEIKSILMKEEPNLYAQAVIKKTHVLHDTLLTLTTSTS
jgi:predicted transcriptional regulator